VRASSESEIFLLRGILSTLVDKLLTFSEMLCRSPVNVVIELTRFVERELGLVFSVVLCVFPLPLNSSDMKDVDGLSKGEDDGEVGSLRGSFGSFTGSFSTSLLRFFGDLFLTSSEGGLETVSSASSLEN
jgi:hypothetical protein